VTYLVEMSKKELNAITLADDLVELLREHPSQTALVHSVYPHAVNLLIREDELITLTSQDDIPPMGLMVNCSTSFTEFLSAGDKVILETDQLTAVNGSFTVDFRDAKVWKARSLLNLDRFSTEDVTQNRHNLIRWLAQQPAEGLLPLLPRLTHLSMSSKPVVDNIYSRYIADDLDAFTTAINTSAWEQASVLADRLIGFGMGSTPSCDDFLAAYMIVLAIADASYPGQHPWVRQFNQTIASKAKSRTTLISANMLRLAADGKTSRSHQQLIQTCLFKNSGQLEYSASQVMRHGATSGGDFLLGLICAFEWVQNTMTDISKEGERAWVENNQPQPVPGI